MVVMHTRAATRKTVRTSPLQRSCIGIPVKHVGIRFIDFGNFLLTVVQLLLGIRQFIFCLAEFLVRRGNGFVIFREAFFQFLIARLDFSFALLHQQKTILDFSLLPLELLLLSQKPIHRRTCRLALFDGGVHLPNSAVNLLQIGFQRFFLTIQLLALLLKLRLVVLQLLMAVPELLLGARLFF